MHYDSLRGPKFLVPSSGCIHCPEQLLHPGPCVLRQERLVGGAGAGERGLHILGSLMFPHRGSGTYLGCLLG